MEVGEKLGVVTGLLALAAWCFTCQFLRSRGDVQAHRRNWSGMLLVGALPVAIVVLMMLVERRGIVLTGAPAILIAGVGGTYAGALAAAVIARRTVTRS